MPRKKESEKRELPVIEELKIKTETFYAIQKLRIQASLRVQAFERDGRLDKLQTRQMHHWVDGVIESVEGAVKKEMAKLVQKIPIYTEFLSKVPGLGPALSASLYAAIYDIGRFATISKLWAYSVGKVENGEAARRKKGQKINWNPFLRMTMYKITDSFVKQKPKEGEDYKCQYRRIYDVAKEHYRRKHPEPVEEKGSKRVKYTDLHIHNMAKRKAGKIFLAHLWLRWRELEGLPVSDPYIIGKEGGDGRVHTTIIEPWV